MAIVSGGLDATAVATACISALVLPTSKYFLGGTNLIHMIKFNIYTRLGVLEMEICSDGQFLKRNVKMRRTK